MTKNIKEADWSYGGEYPPERWHELYPLARSGERQSPVALDGASVAALEPLELSYKKWIYSMKREEFTIKLIPEISDATKKDHGGRIEPFLEQIHFHRPSEHCDSKGFYPMEMHLVHNRPSGIVVVGVFITVGAANTELEAVFRDIPSKTGEVASGLTLDINKILPEKQGYYSYDGSLTTPPCTEGVKWLVLKDPVSVSEKALRAYKSEFPEESARPVCPLNGRRVMAGG